MQGAQVQSLVKELRCHILIGAEKKMCMKSGSVKVLVAPLCPTLRDPIDCSLPGSTVHGMFQAAILKWVAISFSRHLLDPGIEPGSPALHTLFIV